MTTHGEPPAIPVRRNGEGFVLTGERTTARRLVRETWRTRELVVQLARKEFFVRYRRATFGVLWAVVLPTVQALVLATVLSRFIRFPETGHFALYVLSGTLAWSFFATAVGAGTTSITDSSAMSAKIYFPRMVFPLTVVGSGLYGFVISAVVLAVLCVVVGDGLDLSVLLLVPALVWLLLLTAPLTVLLAGLNVYFRDMRYLVQAVLLPLFYLTPIFYPLSVVGGLRRFIEVNPMTGIVQLVRAATVGAEPGWAGALWWSAAWTVAAIVGALAFHARYDRVMSDLL
jgi:ABC-type polysaccharide/polyol phosphate export permease